MGIEIDVFGVAFWPVEFVAGWIPWRWVGLLLATFVVPAMVVIAAFPMLIINVMLPDTKVEKLIRPIGWIVGPYILICQIYIVFQLILLVTS